MTKITKTHIRIIFALLILSVVSTAIVMNGASAPPKNTAPTISNVAVSSITDTSADIAFTVDQIDSIVTIDYGTTKSMTKSSSKNTDASLTRTIQLSGLSASKTYYYSINAQNGTSKK